MRTLRDEMNAMGTVPGAIRWALQFTPLFRLLALGHSPSRAVNGTCRCRDCQRIGCNAKAREDFDVFWGQGAADSLDRDA